MNNTKEKILSIVDDTDKNFSPYYGMLPAIINERHYSKGIEIGVFCGGHSLNILEKTQIEKLYGIDPYMMYPEGMPKIDSQHEFDELFYFVMQRLAKFGTRYEHIRNDSVTAFRFLQLGNEKFDFVFIDGSHSATDVTFDIENFSELIRTGGVIACHDYNHPFFPYITGIIDNFARKHNAKVHLGPLHFIWIDKTW